MNLHQEIVPLVGFAVVAASTYLLLAALDPYWIRVRRRVEQLDRTTGDAAAAGLPNSTASTRASLQIAEFMQRFGFGFSINRQKLQQRLEHAGIYASYAFAKYYSSKLILMLLAAVVTMAAGAALHVRADFTLLVACLAGGVGAIAPSLWLDKQVARQHLLLGKSLPDFLDLMIVCLQGGLSLQETIRRVGDELRLAHPTLAFELSIVQRDTDLGASIEQALKRFAARSGYEGVRTLSTFIREAQRFGTNITEALRSHADMLRSQREQVAEESAQKAAVKILLPTMLLIFPAIFVVAVGPALIQIQQAFAGK